MFGLDKLFGGDLDPNSPMGQAQAEAIKDMIQESLKTEKGKKLISFIINSALPAIEELKKEMGNDDKRYMVYKEGDSLVFITIDMNKTHMEMTDESAILTYKKLDNIGELVHDFISGKIMAAEVKTEVKKEEQKAIG